MHAESQAGGPAGGNPVVEVVDLRKTFGESTALHELSFQVAAGEIVGLLGANGAGKTTAIHILLGLTTPTSGSARIFGLDIARDRAAILQRCNFSSAYTNVPMNLKVWENLHIFSLLYNVRDWKRKARELLEMFEIGHLRNRISGQLSSGEGTRLNLCKALLNDPELLLLDEPTASLDPDMADKLRKSLRRIQRERGIAMIYTSHNMRDVEEVCDRVLFMDRGRLIAEGTSGDVLRRFQRQSLEDVFIAVARGGDIVNPDGKEEGGS